MPSIETLVIFSFAAVLMNLSPGPSNLYVMARSISQGVSGGVTAAGGLALGGLVHVFAAALGLSAIFLYSPTAYLVMKVAGACYLIYLGVGYLKSRKSDIEYLPDQDDRDFIGSLTTRQILNQSFWVEVLNPKTALFFLAFLPQFVDVTRSDTTIQFLILGIIVTLSAIPCDIAVAYFGGRVGEWMKNNESVEWWQNKLSGSIMIGLGGFVAVDAISNCEIDFC
jgi:threonine/homoserine/homoserine lactone efflux protein